ncbi:MAG: DUF1080 domain-containing protein [Candidatus Omnitrophica bacterium]|nr:DUF1080 domain-containing protein [Candidatus Omnitrophota bacterium]
MKMRYVVVFIVVGAASMAYASEKADDFVDLFNGRNLEGWVNVNCAPETWTVRDEMIVCTGIPTGVLRTERMYENYILELEYKHMKERGNAGLFLHSWDITALGQPFTRSIECQVMDGNGGDVFAIHGAQMTPDKPHPKGWNMRSLPVEFRQNPAGEWNHYRIVSRDGSVALALNGKVVTRGYHCAPRKGYICLESEGSEVYFRNIRIQERSGGGAPADVTAQKDRGFRSLYNGLDFRGWRWDAGHEGHWRAHNWILEYDGKSEAEDKNLWTEDEYENFTLIVDWRMTRKPEIDHVPIVLPDGSYLTDEQGEPITAAVRDAGDSGIYLRGSSKSQINIWQWPCGSGEIWGYRLDPDMPPEVRRGATPILNADNRVGEWNRFEITLIGDVITVVLNGKTVIREARLPGIPPKGPIALQHHGDPIQFANLYIKELD